MASKISINLDTSKENYILTKCKQDDDLTLEASIYENGLALDLSNKEIMIKALKADNTYIIQSTEITKESNKILAELDRDFSRVPGTTKIEVLLIEGGKQNTTFSFYLEVVESVTKGAVESDNTVTILEELDKKVLEAGQVKVETEQLIKTGGAATTGQVKELNASLEHVAINVLNLPLPYSSAVGGDANKDTVGIQNAIDYAYEKGFKTVILPSDKIFLINNTLKLKKGIKLTNGTIRTVSNINAIELFDNSSAFCGLENIIIDGNDVGEIGVFLNRTNVILGWDITKFTFLNVTIQKFKSHGIDLGMASDRSLMEIVMDNVFCYYNGGYGIHSLRATDSLFNNVFLRQNRLGGGYFIANSCKFNNIKSYANGYGREDGVSPGLYLSGSSNMFNNVECQENTGNGIEINALTNSLLELSVDKNGVNNDISIPTTPTYDGLTINNSNNLDIRVALSDMGFVHNGKYSQRYGFVLKSQCKNIDIKYTIREVYKEYNSESTTNNNIKINKVGENGLKLKFMGETQVVNGVTFTKINNDLVSVNGTATANANFNMYGVFGDPTYNKITYKAGQKILLKLAEKEIPGVSFYLISNSNTVLGATSWDSIIIPSIDGYINNIYIRVNNGTSLNNLMLEPVILIAD